MMCLWSFPINMVKFYWHVAMEKTQTGPRLIAETCESFCSTLCPMTTSDGESRSIA